MEGESFMRKGIMKRVASVGLVATMMASLVACGGSTTAETTKAQETTAAAAAKETEAAAKEEVTEAAGDSGEQIQIKFFHRFPDEPYNTFIETKIAEYEAANPNIDIVVSSAQNDPFKEKIQIVVSGEDCPDIFFSWAGEFTERLLDLTPYMESDQEWKASLMESQMAEYTTSDGMVYGVPFRLDGKMVFYNTEIFADLGLEIPETWDEFIAVCDAVLDAGITPLSYGNIAPWASAHYVGTLNQMLVPQETIYKDYEPTTGEFTDPGYVEALEYYQQLIPYFTPGANGLAHDMARSLFAQGNAAMFYAELIEIPYVEEINADLDYGMFNFPIVEGAGETNILTGSPEGFVVSSKTQYPDECVEFMKWFLGAEVGAQQAQEIGWFNAAVGVGDAVSDPTLVMAYDTIANAEVMGPWFDSSLYSTVCDEYLTAISDLTNGDVTPEEVMAKIQKVAKEAQSLVQ